MKPIITSEYIATSEPKRYFSKIETNRHEKKFPKRRRSKTNSQKVNSRETLLEAKGI
jgi:hypothetical protein